MQNESKFCRLGRKPAIYAVICFFLIAVTPFMVLGQIPHSVSFERSDIVLTTETAENGITYSKLSIKNLSETGEVGKPSLPTKYVKLIVPSDQNVETVVLGKTKKETIPIPYTIFPTQEAIRACIDCPKPDFVEPDPAVYKSDKPYPAEIVEIVHDGYFDGSNHIVTVAIYPIQYQPASGILTFFSSVDFEIRMKSGKTRAIRVESRTAKNQETYNSILKTIVDNPQDLLMYQTTTTLIENTQGRERALSGSVPFYEYVIITSSALESYFDDFVSWKIRKGLDVGVVTVEEIYDNYTGDEISGIYDEPGKIRQYLSDAWHSGTTEYALLAGDHTIVPVRYGCGTHNTWRIYDWPGDNRIPSDLYFADFNGDWEYDHDVYTGEEDDDLVDYNPEIFVGRLPCVDGDDINNWTEKVLKYEQNPGNGDRNYLTSSFWVRGPGAFESDIITQIIQHIPPAFQTTDWSEIPPIHKGSEVVTEMNNHGLIQLIGHGAPTNIKVKKDNEANRFVWTTDNSCYFHGCSDEEGDGLDNMINTDYYSIMYTGSCNVAAFDDFLQDKWPGRCMAEGWLFFESICGPAFLANSRYGWVNRSEYLSMEFYDLLTLGTADPANYGSYLHLGVSELISKLNYLNNNYNERWNHYQALSHTLFGCPETQIWTDIPSEFTNVSITDNGTSLTVNTGVNGCNICVCSIDDGATCHMLAHRTSSYTFTTSVRPVYVTITKFNKYIPYTTLFPNYVDVVAGTEGGIETSPVVMDVNGDNKQEIFIACDDGSGDDQGAVYAYDYEWNLLWKRDVAGTHTRANPCISDLNNDGIYELVVATSVESSDGNLYVFNAIDGSNFGTWPKYHITTNHLQSSPACGDVDGDGYKEVIIGTSSGIKTFKYDGSSFVIDYEGLEFDAGINLVDIDGDEVLDICGIARGYEDPCVVLEPGSGTSRSDGPEGGIFNIATMAVVGVAGNLNYNEWADMVSIRTGALPGHVNRVHCWQYRNFNENWVTDELWSYNFDPHEVTLVASPAIADVDDNGYNEVIVVGERPETGSEQYNLTIKCFEHDGSEKWNHDIDERLTTLVSSPSLGDIDNDGRPEVLVGISNHLYSFNAEDGTPTDFPIKDHSGQIWSSPLISDIDNDGIMEIIVTTLDNFVYCWEAGECDIGEVEWGMFHRDSRNSGVYHPADLILRNITVEMDQSIGYQAFNTITAAGESFYFTIEGNGSTGGNVTMEAGNYISLLSGFEAQEGCTFGVFIDNIVLSEEKISDDLTLDYEPGEEGTGPKEIEGKKEIKESIPKVFTCAQNKPNPFVRSTIINYGLPKDSDVNLTVFNIAGQAVRTLVNGQQSTGFKSVSWDGCNSVGIQMPQGIYFYVFKAGNFEKHHKMILVR